VTGNENPLVPSVAGAIAEGVMPAATIASSVAGSGTSPVCPPARTASSGVALSETLPTRSPRLNSLVSKARFRAAAAALVSRAPTPLITVSRPLLETFALSSDRLNTRNVALPAFAARNAFFLPITTRKFRRATDSPPAESFRPPEWST
jgi:hypothetical protein